MPLRSRLPLATVSLILLAGAAPADKPKGIVGKSDPCTIMRIVDGDTADVQIRGKEERLRLLAIDTEESWPSAAKPVTEFGLETSKWAKSFLSSEEPCWVEYGLEKRDVYDRLLAYLWRKQDGEWRMYNLQSVERGYSPYFTKYGYSEHHHKAFVEAEKRARTAQKGIWDPANERELRGKYEGPDGLRAWWDERAEALKAWDAVARDREDIYDIRHDWRRVKPLAAAGKRATVFTAVRQAGQEGSLWVGKCEGRLYEAFQIVPANGDARVEEVLRGTIGYFRYFTGVVEMLDDGKTLRLTVEDAADVALAPPPRPKTGSAKKARR